MNAEGMTHRISVFALLMLAAVLCCAVNARGQAADSGASCYAERKTNPPFKKKLWDGYEISLGSVRDSQAEYVCTGAIYRVDGKVVFRTTGFNVVFDAEDTGLDFDGDGKPDVVFKTDTGGGNNCCWVYNIVSLHPKPRKLFDIDQEGAVQFKRDEQRKIVIWKRTSGNGTFAEKVFRVREGKLVDVTPEFCGRILSDQSVDYREETRLLTTENIRKLQAAGAASPDSEETVSALLSRALQHVFCRQFDAAIADLDGWPEKDRVEAKRRFANALREDYPEFSARLANKDQP
jgi:hypothetical protein